jgi:hypothetical protein
MTYKIKKEKKTKSQNSHAVPTERKQCSTTKGRINMNKKDNKNKLRKKKAKKQMLNEEEGHA